MIAYFKEHWKVSIGLFLLTSSLLLSVLHVFVFHDSQTFLFYIALDLAFVPIQVFLVSLVLDNIMKERERKAILQKMNMVIGAFFSEVGNETIRRIGDFCQDSPQLAEQLNVTAAWSMETFRQAADKARVQACRLDEDRSSMEELKTFLLEKRSFVLGLLQNPNLLEHDDFTDLLWAWCHLTEELAVRPGFDDLPRPDVEHLQGDMRRCFVLLVRQWLSYMRHLKSDYPYIYSLAMRTNPFTRPESAVVRS